MTKIKPILSLIRVHQWVKNSFIGIPLFFSGKLLNTELYPTVGLGIFTFSIIASCIYILNDSLDVEKDRLHPTKRNRPLASGVLSISFGVGLAAFLLLLGGGLSFLLPLNFQLIVLFYFLLNVLYSTVLKKIALVDIFIVAIGFVLRIFAGGALFSIEITNWLVVMVFCLALFLAVAKRRDDLILVKQTGISTRKALKGYNMAFVDHTLAILVALILMAYLMYTLMPENTLRYGTSQLYLTTFWVVAGMLRYLQVIFIEEKSGAPTKVLLTDTFLQLVLLGWVSSFLIIIYF